MASQLVTGILSTHTPALFAAAVRRAAELLRQGEVVALPTETVYGLAANALDARAVARIFEIKGRPAHNPIIVHVASQTMAERCVQAWPAVAAQLARAFWPGPLTLVLPKAQDIPDNVTAGGATVGVRWPSHPFIQAVIRECDFPLAAPSANLSNYISPTSAEHVRQQLDGKISLIVDGGHSQVGIESTVLDLVGTPPTILRPGMIHRDSLAAVCGTVRAAKGPTGETLRSPGLLKKHYSPKTKTVILRWTGDQDLVRQLAAYAVPVERCFVIVHSQIPNVEKLGSVNVIPHDAEAFARALYAELYRCDAAGAGLIVVEAPPDTPEWSGIADRLRRAAA
jgi:L-threonylcarbamoyladenylate synthase